MQLAGMGRFRLKRFRPPKPEKVLKPALPKTARRLPARILSRAGTKTLHARRAAKRVSLIAPASPGEFVKAPLPEPAREFVEDMSPAPVEEAPELPGEDAPDEIDGSSDEPVPYVAMDGLGRFKLPKIKAKKLRRALKKAIPVAAGAAAIYFTAGAAAPYVKKALAKKKKSKTREQAEQAITEAELLKQGIDVQSPEAKQIVAEEIKAEKTRTALIGGTGLLALLAFL